MSSYSTIPDVSDEDDILNNTVYCPCMTFQRGIYICQSNAAVHVYIYSLPALCLSCLLTWVCMMRTPIYPIEGRRPFGWVSFWCDEWVQLHG
jgi:hypothetical protein